MQTLLVKETTVYGIGVCDDRQTCIIIIIMVPVMRWCSQVQIQLRMCQSNDSNSNTENDVSCFEDIKNNFYQTFYHFNHNVSNQARITYTLSQYKISSFPNNIFELFRCQFNQHFTHVIFV